MCTRNSVIQGKYIHCMHDDHMRADHMCADHMHVCWDTDRVECMHIIPTVCMEHSARVHMFISHLARMC